MGSVLMLSKEEFNKKIYGRISNLIKEYNLIGKNDLIAIAISGGKDSLLTLYSLSKLQKTYDFNLIAISVDEGISDYRNHGIDSAIKYSKIANVDLVQKSFKEEFDFNLDDVYSLFKSACIPCGVFRRNILNKTAYELGADKIATGHNLDDEIQSFLMSFSRADTIKFSKFGPKLDKIHPKLVPRIKPLWNTPEKEVGMWAVINEIDVHLEECPYSKLSLRSKTKHFLNVAEDENPGVKKNILESFKKSFNIKVEKYPFINECSKCGEPSSANLCKSCELLKLINEN